jgi:hypothetical protein
MALGRIAWNQRMQLKKGVEHRHYKRFGYLTPILIKIPCHSHITYIKSKTRVLYTQAFASPIPSFSL